MSISGRPQHLRPLFTARDRLFPAGRGQPAGRSRYRPCAPWRASTRRSSSRCATAIPSGIDGDDEVTARGGREISRQVRRLRRRRSAPARLHGSAAPRGRGIRAQGREIRPDLQWRVAARSADGADLSLLHATQPAADHAYGHDLRRERARRARPADRRRRVAQPPSRAQDDHGPYGAIPGSRNASSSRASRPTSIARSRRSSTGPGSSGTS